MMSTEISEDPRIIKYSVIDAAIETISSEVIHTVSIEFTGNELMKYGSKVQFFAINFLNEEVFIHFCVRFNEGCDMEWCKAK